MRNLRKAVVLFLVMAMTLAMASISAFAAGTGSITITPPKDVDTSEPITYKVYKVFDAEGNGDAISYKLVEGKTTAPAGFNVDKAGNVSYAGGEDVKELTAADIAAIAAYVTEDDIVATVRSTGGANAVASNLPNGYYYITTSVGTVVTIDSTNPDASVNDKNTVPGVDKKIIGASSYDEDGKKALAQIGTEVEYEATITLGVGRVGYVFKDTLGTGLKYVDGSLKVEGMTEDKDFTVSVSGQTISAAFDDDTIKALKDTDEIVVTYKAIITRAALHDNPAKNTATISYGHDSQYTSKPSEALVYNAQISVVKKDGDGKPLAGAGFVLQNADGKYYTYTNNAVAWVDSIDDADEHFSDANGDVEAFIGLANGTYTLVEKTVPEGYNKAADEEITIKEHDYTAPNLVQEAEVVNNAGAVLPTTGGIGTTIFYVLGSLLAVVCGIVLVSRKRMQNNK